MADLVTLSTVKTALEIPDADTSRDAVLSLLITEVSGLIEDYCGRTFGAQTITEYYSGDNTPILVLNQRPVSAVVSVWEDEDGYWGQGDDPFDSDHLLTAGSDYALQVDQPDGSSRCGLLYRINGSWSRPAMVDAGNLSARAPYGTGNIKVRYTAGFGTIPGAVQLAAQLSVSYLWRMMKFGGLIQSETTPKYAYTRATNHLRADGVLALPPEALSMLSRYRNLPIA